jgi:hypothetical protein
VAFERKTAHIVKSERQGKMLKRANNTNLSMMNTPNLKSLEDSNSIGLRPQLNYKCHS